MLFILLLMKPNFIKLNPILMFKLFHNLVSTPIKEQQNSVQAKYTALPQIGVLKYFNLREILIDFHSYSLA
jgi:hypothetical protein